MLRRASVADVDLIVAFEAEVVNKRLYGKPLDHSAATAEIDANHYVLHVRDERVVATGALRRRQDGSVYLSNIAVHPEVRRNGLGRAMMIHLLAQSADATVVDLAVHPDNQPARALYESLGFLPGQIEENFFGDGEPRMIMTLERGGML